MSRAEPDTPPDRPALAGLAAAVVLVLAMIVGTGVQHVSRAGDPVTAPDARIDLNVADAGRLAVLPGIGPVLADRIAADRGIRGPFGSVGEIARVHGIGPQTVDRITPFVSVRPADDATTICR